MATLNVNLPDTLYEALKARADALHRSVSEEVTEILAQVLAPEPLSLLDLEGLGKESWARVDAARHVEEERASWD